MSLYAGNTVVLNTIMRWPWMIVPAAAIGIVTVLPDPKQAPPPPALPPIVAPAPVPPPPPPPLVVKKAPPPPLEVLCPPIEKTVKLSKKEKKVLIDKGCKVRG